MTRNNIFTVMTMTIMMMASANTFAQGRGGNSQMMGGRSAGREMTMNRGGEMTMNRSDQMNMGRGNKMAMNRGSEMNMNCRGEMSMNRGRAMECGMNRHAGMLCVDDRGFVPGWEGRVMYRDGRWGYLRGADWYWYDTYFEPDFYFGRPLDYFRPHIIPVNGRIAAGAAVGAAVGALITALCH